MHAVFNIDGDKTVRVPCRLKKQLNDILMNTFWSFLNNQ